MTLLLLFAFLAGIVTVLSPCILPILPIVLSSGITGDHTSKSRPLGVVVGFILSFTIFTLFLSTLVRISGIPASSLRILSVVIIAGFGISLLIPKFQVLLEQLFSKLSQFAPKNQKRTGFFGGLLVGFSLGLLWTPCVGPILASVISLAITGTVTFSAFLITLAYSTGTALPMLAIMWSGRTLLQRVPWLLANTRKIQKAFGILMILTAMAILTNFDRSFQTFILKTFPQYGIGLTQFEDKSYIQDALEKLNKPTNTKSMNSSEQESFSAPELIPGGVWINSDPLTLDELKGKVVVIDFWTYSCINCQRTFPYLKKWHQTYADKGLVIIGVHAPEFEFEKNENNLRKAIQDFGITYPIMQDNNFATWRAYQNLYWPAKYFIDKTGQIRYTHFGEGAYDESEQIIQQLLEEQGGEEIDITIQNPTPFNFAKTPETYLGFARIDRFVSPESIQQNVFTFYSAPANLPKHTFAFDGEWSVQREFSTPKQRSKLLLHFDAKQVYLVAKPHQQTGMITIYVDGVAYSNGTTIKDGRLEIDTDRLYELVNLTQPGDHILEIEFENDQTDVFAFTFG